MKYRIKHVTHYQYMQSVAMCRNEARMSPINNQHQTCLSHRYVIQPSPQLIEKHFDYFGNQVTHFTILQAHKELRISVFSEVEVLDKNFDKIVAQALTHEQMTDLLTHAKKTTDLRAVEYTLPSLLIQISDAVKSYAAPSFTPGRTLYETCLDLMQRIFTEFKYDPTFTSISTPLEEVIAHKKGICQDFAHLAIACLRSQGLAARYVSGYLETVPPPGQKKLVGADASHAWFSVYFGDGVWLEFDPTNNIVPKQQHITLARGRDYSDVSPLRGIIYGGGEHELLVSVDVNRIG
ncbi:MAG: transglutaminase family protein [Pseudomonadota bacterium]